MNAIVRVADLPGRRALRSAVTNRLTVPAVKLSTIDSRAFSISSPQTWNQLAEEVTSAKSLSISSNVTSKHSYLENHSLLNIIVRGRFSFY